MEDQQFFNLFRSLETNSVRYLVAGGLAMLAYGHSFADTSYIDIWIEDTSTNRKNLRQSFSKAGYGDFQEIETNDLNDCRLVVFIYGSFPIRIFTVIEGAENQLFNFCHEKAEVVNFVGVNIPFMDINDLISSKKSVSRPKDQIDLIELEKIRKIRQQSEDKKTS